MIRSAQRYMDVLIKYAFFAARALEIYTLTDMSDEIRTDYGYIHPDVEQDYADGLLPLAQLIGEYTTSWSRFVDIINYRNAFDSYFGSSDKVDDKVFLSHHRPRRAGAVPPDAEPAAHHRPGGPAAHAFRGQGDLRPALPHRRRRQRACDQLPRDAWRPVHDAQARRLRSPA